MHLSKGALSQCHFGLTERMPGLLDMLGLEHSVQVPVACYMCLTSVLCSVVFALESVSCQDARAHRMHASWQLKQTMPVPHLQA